MVASVYLPLMLLAAIIGMGFALFSWVNRESPGARPLTLFLVVASFWTVAEGLTVADGNIDTMRLWTQIGLSLSVAIPIAWLATVIEYTGREQWLTRRTLVALLIEPVVFLVLVWTNNTHSYVWSNPELPRLGEFITYGFDYGVAFWGHQVYSYLLLATGVGLLSRVLLRSNQKFQWQSTALLGAITVPMVANTMYIFGFLPTGLNPNGIAYVFAGLIFTVALLDSKLLSVAPVTRDIGREAVLSELEDAIVILDDSDRIVDLNPAGEQLLGDKQEYLGQPLSKLRPDLAESLDEITERGDIELELNGKVRYYNISVSTLYRGYGAFSGRVVSLRDVTERRQREQRLDVLNRLLRHNVRNELNLVRGNIELTKANLGDGNYERLDEAIKTVDNIVARSDKVGRLSRLLEAETSDRIDIARELRGEHETGSLSEAEGTVTIALPDNVSVAGGESLVAAFEELVTNALEHNDSEQPAVTLTVNEEESDDDNVVIDVVDNGPGIDRQEVETLGAGRETPLQHSSGVGLWLVNWVTQRAGGTVSFENVEDGCRVSVSLPRADVLEDETPSLE